MSTPKDFGRMNETGRGLTLEPDLQPPDWSSQPITPFKSDGSQLGDALELMITDHNRRIVEDGSCDGSCILAATA